MSNKTPKNKTPRRSTSYFPQATPLYAAFANPVYSYEAETGVIIGWERETFRDGDSTWSSMTPVIVPCGAPGPILDVEGFWDYVGADIEVYEALDDAKAAVPRLTEALRAAMREHNEAQAH